MAGIALLLMIAAYVWFAVRVTRFVFIRLSRLLACLLVVSLAAIPFADAVVGRKILRSKCDELAKVVVKRSVDGVEGIYTHSGLYEDTPKYYGYMIVEGGGTCSTAGYVDRATYGATGVEKCVPSKTLYEITEVSDQSHYFSSERTVVRERATTDELASYYTSFSFRGGWAEHIAMMLSDAGPGSVATCRTDGEMHPQDLEALHRSLKPL
jgi:hypothetical protein